MSDVERIAVVKHLIAEWDAGNVSADDAVEAIEAVIGKDVA